MINLNLVISAMREKILAADLRDDQDQPLKIAWQNRRFDPGNAQIYLEEIVGVDGENLTTTRNAGGAYTFTYNVRVKAGDDGSENYTEQGENLRQQIQEIFALDNPATARFTIAAQYACDVVGNQRRGGEREENWWLGAVDVSINVVSG
jgi:hypothetical protein